METPDWNIYGNVDVKALFGKAFKFGINAKRITSNGIVDAGIDRSSNGQLGVRSGQSTGIDKNEGYLLSLDLKDLDTSVVFELTKIGFTYLDASESCTIVNRLNPGKMMVFSGSDTHKIKEVKITSSHKRKFLDVSSLGISLKGGADNPEFLSFFNTKDTGSFRVSCFEFTVK